MPCRLQKSVIWSLFAVIVSAGAYVRAQSQTGKISTFKLENYGWQPLPRMQHVERPGTRSRLVSIDHKGRVLVGFTARENLSLATREHPELSLHILRFTPQGKIDLSLLLPTKDYFTNGFYLGANDQIIARANESLQIVIGETQNPQTLTWKTLAPCSMNCRISQSPSRRTLIISESQDSLGHSTMGHTAYSTYTVFDASSLPPRVVQTCSRMAFYAEKITDKFEYWDGSEGGEPFTRRFPFCDVDHPQELPLGWGGILFAPNDAAFLRLGVGKRSSEVELIGSDGQIKFRHELPRHDVPLYYAGAWATSDERGDRFAFVVETWRGGSRLLDISGNRAARRVVAYTETGQEIASVPVSTTYHHDFDFSLSPDGHHLAILDEGELSVVELD